MSHSSDRQHSDAAARTTVVTAMAWVTVDNAGNLTDESTVTVGDVVRPVPKVAACGMQLPGFRIGEALRAMGWGRIDSREEDTSRPNLLGIHVDKVLPA